LELLQGNIKLSHLFLERLPFPLHFRMQSKNFAINSQAILHTPLNNRQDSLNCWTIMKLLSLIALNLLAHGSGILQVATRIDSLPELDNTSINGFVHLLCLSTGSFKYQNPPILAQFFS
jgi:hypothetical protein